jgi:hypothetical protein
MMLRNVLLPEQLRSVPLHKVLSYRNMYRLSQLTHHFSLFEEGIALEIIPMLPLPAVGNKSYFTLLCLGCACF